MLDHSVTWLSLVSKAPVNVTPTSYVKAEELEYIDMEVEVVPDWNSSVFLEWISPEDLGYGLKYIVYYSESELGPFLQLNQQPISDTKFYTTWQAQDSKAHEQYFTIEVLLSNGTKYRSYPKTPSYNLPKWHILRHKEIIRREALLLDRFAGVESVIFTRKWRGKRCPHCWDEIHKKVLTDHCEHCYGTGYDGGYDIGMGTKLQYTSIDHKSRFSYQGREEPNVISAWGLPFPLIHPGAVILRLGDNRAFVVDSHQGSTEMLTNTQRQTVILKELGRDSVEYLLFKKDDVVSIQLESLYKKGKK